MKLLTNIIYDRVDIIGDIHGELDALKKLVEYLGYDTNGNHPNERKLIFIGDLVDRGPYSYGVVMFVKNIVERQNGQMILGNHEINVLQNKAKSGSGWYFDEQIKKDSEYAPFHITNENEKKEIFEFLSNQPIALENNDLRIVHAAWINDKINEIKHFPLGTAGQHYTQFEDNIDKLISSSGLLDNYHQEQQTWEQQIEDKYFDIPFLDYTCDYNLIHQMNNPLRVLTSGVEVKAEKKFFASGKWRFVQRQNWWDYYTDEKPVVIGHYWRSYNSLFKSQDENVFSKIEPNAWFGKNKNVFCIDYSVGTRFLERKFNLPIGTYGKLAALRWPEKNIIFENGFSLKTI